MTSFNIHIGYVSWGSGGKRRPVLILTRGDGEVTAFPITSQITNMSKKVRKRYYFIADLAETGLVKPSAIDIGVAINLLLSDVSVKPIGKLSDADKTNLIRAVLIRQQANRE